MKITYIYHSAFCIETKDFAVIIDFYKDTKDLDGYVYKEILPKTKKLYVLSTHSHLDHFNGEVLNWKRKTKDITYIFHHEILEDRFSDKDEAIFIDKLEEYRDENIFVKAYGSTDVGGSFYLEIEGKKIFHAGDLNNWHWNEESSAKEIEEAEAFYTKELALLSKDVKMLDVAMFPIDPKLGKDFMKGASQFLDAIKTSVLFPMHFDQEYEKVATFEPIAKTKECNYIALTQNGQSITI